VVFPFFRGVGAGIRSELALELGLPAPLCI